jgi:hypothetical protein
MVLFILNPLQKRIGRYEHHHNFKDHRLIKASVDQVIRLNDVDLASLPPDEKLVVADD